MSHWLRQFKEATPQTKYFILTALSFGLLTILTTIYCYLRLG